MGVRATQSGRLVEKMLLGAFDIHLGDQGIMVGLGCARICH